jgi:ABC-type transport system involved in multi-copper enzyme maturation permease subunit
MTPVWRLFFGELWKLFKRPMTWTLGIILIALMILVYGTLIATILVPDGMGLEVEVDQSMGSSLEESLILPDGLYMGIGLVQLIVTTLIIILAAGMVGSDLSWGTVRTMLMMGAGRIQILIAKVLALATIGLIAILTGLALSIAGSVTTGIVTGRGAEFSSWLTTGFFTDAGVLIGRAMVGVMLWAIVSATVTLITRSLAAGLGASLALLFLGGQMGGLLGQLGDVGLWMGRALPNAGVDALTQLNALIPPTYSAGDWSWIIANIVGWIVVLAIAAIITFKRMDTLAASS